MFIMYRTTVGHWAHCLHVCCSGVGGDDELAHPGHHERHEVAGRGGGGPQPAVPRLPPLRIPQRRSKYQNTTNILSYCPGQGARCCETFQEQDVSVSGAGDWVGVTAISPKECRSELQTKLREDFTITEGPY